MIIKCILPHPAENLEFMAKRNRMVISASPIRLLIFFYFYYIRCEMAPTSVCGEQQECRGILETILELCLILCCLLFHAHSLNQDHTYHHNQTNHVCHSSRDQQCNTANHNQDSHQRIHGSVHKST